MNITFEQLQKTHGDKAKDLFRQIGKIGGWGEIGENHDGGLDLSGLSDAKKAQIDKLLAVDEPEAKTKKEGK